MNNENLIAHILAKIRCCLSACRWSCDVLQIFTLFQTHHFNLAGKIDNLHLRKQTTTVLSQRAAMISSCGSNILISINFRNQ